MATPQRERAGTASPASRTPRNDPLNARNSRNSPFRHSPRRSEILVDELSALHLREELAWRQRQDERDAEQEHLHQQALAQAAAEHERILRNAIEVAETEALKQERERVQKEEEEHRALEAERSAKIAREAAERRRKKEELVRLEQEQQRREAEEREIREKEARIAEQKRKDEADALRRKQEQEASERKAKDEAAAAAAATATTTKAAAQQAQSAQVLKPAAAIGAPGPAPSGPQTVSSSTTQAGTATSAQPATQPSAQTTAPSAASGPAKPAVTASPLKSTPAHLQAVHNQYLEIHKRLKVLRKNATTQCKQAGIPIGDYRRKLIVLMNQFTADRPHNRTMLKKVLEVVNDVQKYPEPTLDITPFLAIPSDNVERRMPLCLVYLMHIIAKNAISSFCSQNETLIDATAILLATVFSKTEYLFNGTTSLLDILLAKYHVVCPVLFGIYGNEKTRDGRARIGWQCDGDGEFIDLEIHKNRMSGLAIGYGCLSLRDFSKSKMQNPFPPPNYWKALSHIANTPPAHLQSTHFMVLRALVETHVEKFLKFYGQAGLAALRQVLVLLPKSAPEIAAKGLVDVLPQSLRQTKHLTL
ncbi:GLE1-domain-containing protein [Aureobasidium subglaciale]|nr:GLE1-domain-containing protein [Aureobasidium subglaciale]